MNIRNALTIGQSHQNHCEDYLVYSSIGNEKWLFAVLDGCTMGNESYFASALTGKILKKIATERCYRELNTQTEIPPADELKEILQALFAELKIIRNQLQLEKYDLLTTLILFVFNSRTEQGEIIVVGDGIVHLNGKMIEFDQQNQPDYLGYHLQEKFEEWFEKQQQRVTVNQFSDISICTDGILTFEKFGKAKQEAEDPVNYLLSDNEYAGYDNMLTRKLAHLEHECGLKPLDDLAIIRILK